MMKVGDHVYLDDSRGRNYGKVTARTDTGICSVKWDSGTTERVHESELHVAVEKEVFDDFGVAEEDPKHPSFRERLASWWDDFRPGK